MTALFEQYPSLHGRMPHIPLGCFPTPVQRCRRLGGRLGVDRLFIKRDDVSGTPYGGNKIRKLEFLLGEAVEQEKTAVLTYGGAGSNHALATAVYARQTGTKCIALLVHQLNARSVGRNLLMHLHLGTDLRFCRSFSSMRRKTLAENIRRRLVHGSTPYIIPMGGTSPLGAAGYVGAGLELAKQVDEGLLPEPDVAYLPLGTMGSAVGLALGFEAAGLRTRVAAVRVVDGSLANWRNAARLFDETNAYIAALDGSFGRYEPTAGRLTIVDDFFGGMYGRYTPEGAAAVRMMAETEGLRLEGTYTGKALAALVSHAGAGLLEGETVLFWNTYNSRDFSGEIDGLDYRRLPKAFHRYFETDVQPLDRGADSGEATV
ncbi:MAG: pyridoxal-phosphate dependent enzyme [Candidatus Latescibacteria bacterium]|nr:pyridoxal-phosphate dependent enzyme [Candidatus Latescibacterota bacterium]